MESNEITENNINLEFLNSYQPLKEWFERNQELINYFILIKNNQLSLDEEKDINYDILVFKKMALRMFQWLEQPETLVDNQKKAIMSALCIANIYEEEKEKLSENAKIQYFLDIEPLQNEDIILKR